MNIAGGVAVLEERMNSPISGGYMSRYVIAIITHFENLGIGISRSTWKRRPMIGISAPIYDASTRHRLRSWGELPRGIDLGIIPPNARRCR